MISRGLTRGFRSDDLREAFTRCTRSGWTARRDGRGHVVLNSPDGRQRVRLSATAYSGPATRAKVREMERRGALGATRRAERAARRRRRQEAVR